MNLNRSHEQASVKVSIRGSPNVDPIMAQSVMDIGDVAARRGDKTPPRALAHTRLSQSNPVGFPPRLAFMRMCLNLSSGLQRAA
jgi:hypothetical protein